MWFIVFGSLLLGINWTVLHYSEPIAIVGYLLVCIGIVLAFIAIFRGEQGKIFIMGMVLYLIFILCVTLLKPFELVQLVGWLKRII
ncbi:hypothetical protein WMZ97_09905 [Lentibacillus sp. N15]